jgi:SprT protein
VIFKSPTGLQDDARHRTPSDQVTDNSSGDTMTPETMMNPSRPEQAAATRTRDLLRKAENWLGLVMPRVEIRFDLRGTSAGQARVCGKTLALIRYNPTLLGRHPAEFIAETVPHEVAHVVAFAEHGARIRPHGAEWQGIMRYFGVAPTRCHGYDVSRLRTRALRRFLYRCDCGTHEISSIRHNRIRTRGVVYLCRRCRQPLLPDLDTHG